MKSQRQEESEDVQKAKTDVLKLKTSFEALRESPDLTGPAKDTGEHEHDHFAVIYETEEEQLASVVPFIQQGIERGERCMYVIDELSEEKVIARLKKAGVDAESALESGQLSFHTVDETYLRNGNFEPEEMIEFYAAAIDEANENYEALRITAETTWLQRKETTIRAFMEYESKINPLFEEKDCIALCQYDRNAFSPETVRDIIRTHPHLIYDNTVCHNFYHTPPEEFFGPDEANREAERMMGTLVDRTRAKNELEEREKELERTVEQLERSNAELKRFAHAASHDLQEPLRMVSSYLQLLESEYEDELDNDAQEFINFAVDGADRMREMVDALLKYSRLDRDSEEFGPVDTEELLKDAENNLKVAIEEKEAEINFDNLPEVTGNRNQLTQLFQNLIDNALTYSGEEKPKIHVSAEKQRGKWIFSVQDNGIGIEPEKIEDIFEVFKRLHANDECSGTGIDLSICQRIIDIHGGRIWAESELKEGSTFHFTLPESGGNH